MTWHCYTAECMSCECGVKSLLHSCAIIAAYCYKMSNVNTFISPSHHLHGARCHCRRRLSANLIMKRLASARERIGTDNQHKVNGRKLIFAHDDDVRVLFSFSFFHSVAFSAVSCTHCHCCCSICLLVVLRCSVCGW
jgi:hypothetical protein